MVKIGNIELGEFPLLLAPMEDVSDPPFRAVCKDNGADLMYTEFISSEGLIRDAIKSLKKLDIFDYERPIGIQIFGGDEESMELAAKIVDATNPDLLDINFGCPVKKVVCKGAGAAILKDLPQMVKITDRVVKSTKLPVTVKTRLGWDDNTKNIEEVAERLFDVGIKALSIHGRTRAQLYKGEADWTLISKVKNNPRIHVYSSHDAYDEKLFNSTFANTKFDLVLDDGPHTLESMKQCIRLYTQVLADDGILIIEDVQDWDWIETLKNEVPDHLKEFIKAYDLRKNKGRYDDIVFTIDKLNQKELV
jgi:nifR3 family TIM-barrel protein